MGGVSWRPPLASHDWQASIVLLHSSVTFPCCLGALSAPRCAIVACLHAGLCFALSYGLTYLSWLCPRTEVCLSACVLMSLSWRIQTTGICKFTSTMVIGNNIKVARSCSSASKHPLWCMELQAPFHAMRRCRPVWRCRTLLHIKNASHMFGFAL